MNKPILNTTVASTKRSAFIRLSILSTGELILIERTLERVDSVRIFPVAGIEESDVAIGDRWQIGTVTFEISQPRQPCWKLARRWQAKSMTAQSISTGKTGWYLRVIEPGDLSCGDEIIVQPFASDQHQRITIAEANDIFYRKQSDKAATQRLISTPRLSDAWRTELQPRLK